MRLLCAVVHVLDGSWRKSLQSQSVVDSDGDPAGHSWVFADYTAYLRLKRKMATFVLRHFHPVHPLQNVKSMTPWLLDYIHYKKWV